MSMMPLKCISWNCKGFNSSIHYALTLLNDCDILCLTETWLRPDELNVIDTVLHDLRDFTFNVFAKSSMNHDDVDGASRGRPYGGMAIICKQKPGLLFNDMHVDNDRIQALKICDSAGNVVEILSYMCICLISVLI